MAIAVTEQIWRSSIWQLRRDAAQVIRGHLGIPVCFGRRRPAVNECGLPARRGGHDNERRTAN